VFTELEREFEWPSVEENLNTNDNFRSFQTSVVQCVDRTGSRRHDAGLACLAAAAALNPERRREKMNELSGGCICCKPEWEIAYVLLWCADGVEKTEEGVLAVVVQRR